MSHEAHVIRDNQYRQIRQPLSGYVLGYERKECWRVRIRIGRRSFLSAEAYASEQSAKAAARNLTRSHPKKLPAGDAS